MPPKTIDVLEVIYWIVFTIIILVLWFVMNRRVSDARRYELGREEAQRFLAEGLSSAKIESFLSMRREGGLYGPFEAGVASVLDKGTK